MFVVILKATSENRVAKRADFSTMAEADTHAALFLDEFPDAFVVPLPEEPDGHWFIDMVAGTLTIVSPPPPDFNSIDQATVDRLMLDSGVMRALLKTLFNYENRIRVLESKAAISVKQFKTTFWKLIR